MENGKASWASIKKIWLRPEAYPIIACVAVVLGFVGYRLNRAARGREVQIVSKQESTDMLANIIKKA